MINKQMRTIKFRGKRVDNGEWEIGNYSKLNGVHFITPKENAQLPSSQYKVDPETVGQFTGLFDKNGKEIYEGDICKFFNPYSEKWYSGLIKYHIGAFGFFKSLDDEYGFEWDFLAIEELQVLGSIHDNPELIK